MQQYILKRRLRHLRSLAVQNISLQNLEENSMDEHHVLSSFFIIENSNGETIYVSETMNGSIVKLQINELRFHNDYNLLDHFIVKLAIRVPVRLLKNKNDEIWAIIKCFKVDLAKLNYLGSHPSNFTFSGTDILLLELQDGWYTTQSTIFRALEPHITHKLKIDPNTGKKSCAFNSLLKLNKLIQYVSDIEEERNLWSTKINSFVEPQLKGKKWAIQDIKIKLENINQRCEKKSRDINKFTKTLESLVQEQKQFTIKEDAAALDDYGTIYSVLSNTNEAVEKLQQKRLIQLITIFKNSILFDSNYGFVFIDEDLGPNIQKLILKTIDISTIMNTIDAPEKKNSMNAYLGYYALFILLCSRFIISRPLPYNIKFMGNLSMIDRKFALCCPISHSIKASEEVTTAIDLFNKDIIQVVNYIRHINDFIIL